MTHELAFERLPDLLVDRDDPELLAHVGSCHHCQRQLFLLSRVDRLLRQRRQARSRRRPLVAIAAATAVAIAAAIALPLRHAAAPARFALKTNGGSIVGRAQVERADAENESIAFVAKGLPTRPSDMYLLWTQESDNGDPVVVGRFMVSHTGACRTRFNLPGTRRPGRFWITPSAQPSRIVAST